jgi:glutamate dehydrogenase/leucine dehydrogenase
MQTIYEVFAQKNGAPHHGRGGVGRPPAQGGFPLDEWGITAHGLFAAALAAEKHIPEFRIKDSSVVIQGFGNVGAPIAEKLAALGARIVGASDINAGLFNPAGLDVAQLHAIRRGPDGLAAYTGPLKHRFDGEHLDRMMEMPCTILVPAARPHAIHPENTPHINTRLVLQGANNPSDLVCEYFLQHRRGIVSLTDFIANSGGVIAAFIEAKADVDADFRARVMAEDGIGRAFIEKVVTRIITENIDEMFARRAAHRAKDITWREIAHEMARDRLRPGADGNLKILPELL